MSTSAAPSGTGTAPSGAALRFAASDSALPSASPSHVDSGIAGSNSISLNTNSSSPPTSRAPPRPGIPISPAAGLRLPTDSTPPENPYAQRAPEVREKVLQQRGGDPRTEQAVQQALAWLAAHQSEDGHWSSRNFDDGCGQCDSPSTVRVDAAVTGLSLLCFLGSDHTQVKDGPYRAAVSKALEWLLAHQDASGDFRHGESMYTHAIVTIAIAESAGMTRDPRLTEPLTRAVRFIERARSEQGGWRYEPGQPGDTSVLGWQVMAMISARRAGIDVSPEALRAAGEFLDSVSRETSGVYCYQSSEPPTTSMTAEGLFVRQLLGDQRDSARAITSLEFLRRSPPKWGKRSSTYYWYYATLALFQQGGPQWDTWNAAVKNELLTHQRTDGKAAGSWDPTDRWSLVGGRVYQTAICTLTLEVYYRYLPMYERGAPAGTPPSGGASADQ